MGKLMIWSGSIRAGADWEVGDYKPPLCPLQLTMISLGRGGVLLAPQVQPLKGLVVLGSVRVWG